MADSSEEKTAPYRKRLAALKSEADQYKSVWQEINEYVLPWSGRFLFSDSELKGVRRGEYVYNSSTYNAIQIAASGLHGGLTSPSRPWFEIVHPDEQMMEVSSVKKWIYDLQENERRLLSQSNFYAKIQSLYYEALAYAQGVMLIEADPKMQGIRVRALTCGEYWLASGADLRVNTLYRKFSMTAGQMRETFPEKNLSQAVRTAIDDNRLDETFYIIQAIQPWGTFDKSTHKTWSYESVYFEEGARDNDAILRRRGYRTQPFVAVRWNTNGDDVYGYGPGWMSLADIRQLQTQERAYVNAVNWIADPAWLVSDSMKDRLAAGEIRPGAIVAANPQEAQNLFRPLIAGGFDFNNIRLKIQETEERIRQAFYNPLFMMVMGREREMTATEIGQLVEEKGMLLGPVLEAFQSELFDPVLARVYDIMQNDFHIVPPPPPELADTDLSIQYISILAMAQKQAGLSNLNHFLTIATQLQPYFPDSMDKINGDEVIDTLYTINPINPSIIRSDDEVAKMRMQRAEQAQQMQTAQNIPAYAGAAKDLAGAQLSPDNALGAAMGMEQGVA